MNSVAIKLLPLVQSALSHSFKRLLSDNAPKECGAVVVNNYSAYVSTFKPSGYTALDILNSPEELLKQLRGFVGFIYSQYNCKRAYDVTRLVIRTFDTLAKYQIDSPQLSMVEVNDDIGQCIDEFINLQVSPDRLSYLNGWQLKSKEGKIFNFAIGQFHEAYGDKLTADIYRHTYEYGRTQKSTTLRSSVEPFAAFLNSFATHCDSDDDLRAQLKANKLSAFLEKVMWCSFSRHLAKSNKSAAFFVRWTSAIKVFRICFIDSGLIDEPVRPILTPVFRESSQPIAKVAAGGKLTANEEKLWLATIPLHIKDETAIQIIEDRLQASEEHVRASYDAVFERIKDKHERNLKLSKIGSVKPIIGGSSGFKKNERVRVGRNHLANSIASFYKYGVGAGFTSSEQFFGGSFYNSDRISASDLVDELNLPTTSTLGALCTLLVLEHPALTPSALHNWELFNKNGQMSGYKQVGNNYVIVVHKNRKGARNAQQDIILNEYSQSIVKTLINHTELARQHLKANPSTDEFQENAWRYMLLKANLKEASWCATLGDCLSAASVKRAYRHWVYSHPSSMSESDKLLLSRSVSLRSARKIRAIRTYIKTHSLREVAEVLGHNTVNVDLLNKYLPSALMDFFNTRWIRQFQNAFIYIAMQESEYLFEAVDIKPENLDEFLQNHGIHDIPKLFGKFKSHAMLSLVEKEEPQERFDEVTLTITKNVMRVLIAIKSIVDRSKEVQDGQIFRDIVSTWYEAATLILTEDARESTINAERSQLIADANKSPLDIQLIVGALTC
ncbi:hypothetical protein CJF42_11925 [Pseudoalteromonas sp. NBT06-2]|uniref:hypothetical protein n=1 Tax=Pseudoalteromonas sp. NBT06-2 TaxID=2025950 RepID=UPI000BA77F7E|nr:hypothetical protein [Pseudoalteromonas sp. NBT06-2]PAJ74188.1 hypothetical protein CJF42_11925 [Pseudoalteromonas sp. NBT06-2]